MREIVLDTETTGLDPDAGHRVIEIGCVELVDHFPTGRSFQAYLNPERDMPPDAQRIHGITSEFLSDKPFFHQVAEEFLEFIGDAPLVIHNASFDLKFLNAELKRVTRKTLDIGRAIDTVDMARNRFPGARVSLDELCKRFSIDLSGRSLHGALLDAELTAQVYLELKGGRQTKLSLGPRDIADNAAVVDIVIARVRPHPLPARISADEIAAHAAFVAAELGQDAVWNWR